MDKINENVLKPERVSFSIFNTNKNCSYFEWSKYDMGILLNDRQDEECEFISGILHPDFKEYCIDFNGENIYHIKCDNFSNMNECIEFFESMGLTHMNNEIYICLICNHKFNEYESTINCPNCNSDNIETLDEYLSENGTFEDEEYY